jgi:N-formylglutamate amidohydrolase
VVATLPHGGTDVPGRFADGLLRPAAQLWSDWHTGELHDFLPDLGIETVAAGWSRFVADVNRPPDRPRSAPFLTGVLSSTTTHGEPAGDVDARRSPPRVDAGLLDAARARLRRVVEDVLLAQGLDVIED